MKKFFGVLLAILLCAGSAQAKIIIDSNGCTVKSVTIISDVPAADDKLVDQARITYEATKDGELVATFRRSYDVSTPSVMPTTIMEALNNFRDSIPTLKTDIQVVITEYTNAV